MGRKIPGKKHRSIVDPEKQRAKRLESLKNKINNPPINADEQEVPRSVLKIIELKKEAINCGKTKKGYPCVKGKVKWKKRRRYNKLLSLEQFLDKDKSQPGMRKPDKFIPKLIQKPSETPESFLHRVNEVTQKILQESQFEDKFHVSIKKDLDTGEILKIEKDKSTKFKRKNKHKKTLSEKKKENKLKKAMENNAKDFSHLKDFVEFGEVVHRPPSNLPPVKNMPKHSELNKKERYKNLILKDLIVYKTNNSSNHKLQLEKEESERKFIVNAYRERKKQLSLRRSDL